MDLPQIVLDKYKDTWFRQPAYYYMIDRVSVSTVHVIVYTKERGFSAVNEDSIHFIKQMHYPEKDENVISTLNVKYALSLLTEKINV